MEGVFTENLPERQELRVGKGVFAWWQSGLYVLRFGEGWLASVFTQADGRPQAVVEKYIE